MTLNVNAFFILRRSLWGKNISPRFNALYSSRLCDKISSDNALIPTVIQTLFSRWKPLMYARRMYISVINMPRLFMHLPLKLLECDTSQFIPSTGNIFATALVKSGLYRGLWWSLFDISQQSCKTKNEVCGALGQSVSVAFGENELVDGILMRRRSGTIRRSNNGIEFFNDFVFFVSLYYCVTSYS